MCGRLLAVLVHVCDVLRQTQVVVRIRFVLDEPQQVEAGQQRRRQLDVLLEGFARVVAAVRRVRRGQDRTPRV